jgi:hypothetical protein
MTRKADNVQAFWSFMGVLGWMTTPNNAHKVSLNSDS